MHKTSLALPVWALITLALQSCGSQDMADVSFSKQIKPIFDKRCVSCHREGGVGHEKTGLKLDSYKNLMAGRVVTPGQTSKSVLLTVIQPSADHAKAMPMKGPKLSKGDVDLIRAWIDQGAKNN